MSVRATPSGQPAGGATPPSPAVSAEGAHQAQFTPGPWRFDGTAVWAPEWTADAGDRVCNSPSDWMEASLSRWEANARLIAAAPELLAAAEGSLGLIESGRIYERQCCSGVECGCHGSTYADEAEHFLRAAIAKARGEVA